MADFGELVAMRDRVAGKRDMETMDSMITRRTCPQGHETGALGVMAGVHFISVDEAVARLRKAAGSAKDEKCGKCGSAIPPGSPATTLFASWLPLNGVDLLISIPTHGAHETAIYRPGGTIRPAAAGEPALREFGPSSMSRGALIGAMFAGKAGDGAQVLQQALQAWPDYPPALKVMARFLGAGGDPKKAMACLQRAIAAAPQDAEAHYALGEFLDQAGDKARAIAEYEAAVRLDPKEPDWWGQLGATYAEVKRVNDSFQAYFKGLETDPHHAMILVNMAVGYLRAQDYDNADAMLARIRPSELASNEALRDAAVQIAVQRASDYMETFMLGAARMFEIAYGFNPQEPKLSMNWGVCLASLGAMYDARIKFHEALRLDPKYGKAQKGLAAAKDACRGQVEEAIIGAEREHTVRYVDSHGGDATLLNFVVDLETTRQLEVEILHGGSLSSDPDLLKLLVAKGHNALLAQGGEGRYMVLSARNKPDQEFIALANAASWTTSEGRTVTSAVAAVKQVTEQGPRYLTSGAGGPPVRLPRALAIDDEQGKERFYPAEYSKAP